MTRPEFIALIGQDIVVDYPFGQELQRWSMKNFYIDEMAKSNIIVSRLLWMLLLPTQEIPTKGSPRMVKEALNDGKGD